MKLIELTCPNCSANLKISVNGKNVFCEHCGAQFLIDDEVTKIKYVRPDVSKKNYGEKKSASVNRTNSYGKSNQTYIPIKNHRKKEDSPSANTQENFYNESVIYVGTLILAVIVGLSMVINKYNKVQHPSFHYVQDTFGDEYDDLQKIFLRLNKWSSEKELLLYIEEYGLPYEKEDYSSLGIDPISYKIAFTKDALKIASDNRGDCVYVTFSRSDNALRYAYYFDLETDSFALLYQYGVFFELKETKPHNVYAGYYYWDGDDNKDGIKISYSIDESVPSDFHKVKDAEDALLQLLGKN